MATVYRSTYEVSLEIKEKRTNLTLPISDGLNNAWSPRKLSNPKEPPRRKLSESRGINLPDIKLHPEALTLTQTEDNVIDTPLPTASPLSRFNTHPFDARRSPGSSEQKLKEIIEICVFLPDRQGLLFKVEGGRVATAEDLLHMVSEHQGITNFTKADQLFAIWMCSPLLEIQLKPYHCPFAIRLQWGQMLQRFTTASNSEMMTDEPMVVVRRNVYLSKRRQMQLVNRGDAEADLLVRDAKECVLGGLYPCPLDICLQLAAYDMALSWGPYNSATHTAGFVKSKLEEILPPYHVPASKKFSLFGWAAGGKGLETQLLDLYKRLSSNGSDQLQWDYLTTCMQLPVYGAAFFHGQMERPSSLGGCVYSDVVVAISQEYFCILDPAKHVALLTVPIAIESCSWTKIHAPTEAELRLPSFYFHFRMPDSSDDHREGQEPRSRLVQIFSKQAVMMDALMNSSISIRMHELELNQYEPEDEMVDSGYQSATPGQKLLDKGHTALCDTPMYKSKLPRMCVATIDSSGKCLEARGLLKNILDGQN